MRAALEFERVGEIGIDAPPDHVGALEPGDGAHMGEAVARHEIGPLHQQEAEIAGEIGLFVIGFAIGAGRVQADARIGARGHASEAGAERLKEGRQPPDVHLAVDGLEGARQVQAVFQRVAEAGRRLGAVVEHPPLAVRAATEIGGEKVEIAPAARFYADQRVQEIGAAGHGGGGQHALAHQFALAIEVGQQRVENLGALGDAGLDHRPVPLGNEQRHMAQRPVAIDGFAIGAIGHALFADIALDGLEAAGDVVGAQPRHLVEEFEPMAARASVRADELVRHAVERLIGRRHLDQTPGFGA